MNHVHKWLLTASLLSGLLLGIPPLYAWVSSNLGGPWLPLLLGWVTVIIAVVFFLER